jgi:hypothetical protein
MMMTVFVDIVVVEVGRTAGMPVIGPVVAYQNKHCLWKMKVSFGSEIVYSFAPIVVDMIVIDKMHWMGLLSMVVFEENLETIKKNLVGNYQA